MKKKETVEQEVLKTLQHLDTQEKIEHDPYFYTRLQSKIEHIGNRKKPTVFRPVTRSAVILAGSFIIAIANLTSAVVFFQESETESYDRSTYITAFADDYSLNQNYSFIYNEDN